MLDEDGDDALPDFSTEHFDVFHKHCTRNQSQGLYGRDVYLAFHRKQDVCYPVIVISLQGNWVEWVEVMEGWRRQGIATEVLSGLEKHIGLLEMTAATEAGEGLVAKLCGPEA